MPTVCSQQGIWAVDSAVFPVWARPNPTKHGGCTKGTRHVVQLHIITIIIFIIIIILMIMCSPSLLNLASKLCDDHQKVGFSFGCLMVMTKCWEFLLLLELVITKSKEF